MVAPRAQAEWSIFLHDWADGRRLGRLTGWDDLSLSYGISRNPTAAFRLPLAGRLAHQVRGTKVRGEADLAYLVSIWRTHPTATETVRGSTRPIRVPMYAGPILSAETTYPEQGIPQLAVSSAGPYWRLSKRIADDPQGRGRTPDGVSFPSTARGDLAAYLINSDIDRNGNHWVRASASGPSPATELNKAGGMLSIAQLVEQLGGSMGGFDWTLDFTRTMTADADGLILADWKGTSMMGAERPEHMLEYGAGRRNLASVREVLSIENMVNRADHAMSDKAGVEAYLVTQQDNSTIRRLGLLEEAVGSEYRDRDLRQAMVDLHVAVRRKPRQWVEVAVKPSHMNMSHIPVPLIDYGLGDRLPVRVVYEQPLIEGGVRVWEVELAVSGAGAEQATLGLYGE